MQKQIPPASPCSLYPRIAGKICPRSDPGVDYCHCLRSGICRIRPNPLTELHCLSKQTNSFATMKTPWRELKRLAWNNVMACWCSAVNTSLMNKGYQPRKAPPCLTCLNTWRIPSQRSTTWSIKTKTRGICLAFFFTAAAFVRAATSVAAGDPRFLPRYW